MITKKSIMMKVQINWLMRWKPKLMEEETEG